MFEEKIANKAVQYPDCMEFIDMFVRFQQDIMDPWADRLRIAKFEVRIDNAWRILPEAQREIIVEALLIKKALPIEVKQIIQIFDGRVVSLR